MTHHPEHAKVENLKAQNHLAGSLAFLLLDSDHWTLSNHRSEPPIDIQIQRVVSDILGIDFEAYQAERVQLLGIAGPDLGVISKVIGWAGEPALPSVDYLTPGITVTVEDDPSALTADEATMIAAVAQAEDAELGQGRVSYTPGYEGDEDEASELDDEAAEDVGLITEVEEHTEAEVVESEPIDELERPGADDNADDEVEAGEETQVTAGGDVSGEPEVDAAPREFIEVGNYKLLS